MALVGINTPIGLVALVGLIPFLILYLRRTKPIEEVFPSLMFMLKDKKKSKNFAFFQRFASNILFYLQFLALLLLGLSVAAPFITLPYDVTRENTVLVIDVSASMQTKYGSTTRFEKAVEEARKHVSGRNSIILAENTPLIVLENEDSNLARDILGKLEVKDTGTNLGSALHLAKDILADRPGRIVVLSDFASTDGPDVNVVKAAISSEERVVDFIDLSGNAENVGIISLTSNKFKTILRIKNYNDVSKTVSLNVKSDEKSIGSSGDITIPPFSIEKFEFETPKTTATIELSPDDDLMVDNFAYIATPPKQYFHIVLITNHEGQDGQLFNLEEALRAIPNIKLDIINPPAFGINVQKEKIDFKEADAVVISDVHVNDVLPGIMKEMSEYVEGGGNIVFVAQDDLVNLNTEGLLPVQINNKVNRKSKACVHTVNQVMAPFENVHCFATLTQYHAVTPQSDAIIFSKAADGTPLIVFKPFGYGKVIYHGIMDTQSDFKLLTSYPIYWDKLVDFLVEAQRMDEFNFKSGRLLSIREQDVQTPSGTLTTTRLLLDESGFYRFNDATFAVNLVDVAESNVGLQEVDESRSRNVAGEEGTKQQPFNVGVILAAIGLLLVIFELIMVKFRGEL